MPKISFCVTYYNQAEFVEQSIKSILLLKIPCDFEILIGDDGSTDDTLIKLKEWQKQCPDKIKIFIMPRENNIVYNAIHRASANRLNLVKNATGNYIMFLDGDDFYCDVNFMCEALERFKQNDKLIACAFNFEYFYPRDNSVKVFEQNLQIGIIDINNGYIPCGYIHCGAIVFKNIFDEDKIALCKESRNFDDNLITIYLFQFGEVYFINKPIYTYRQTDKSIYNSMSEYEQYLLNAMDYEIISFVAPKFKKALAKRQFSAIRQVFKNKKRAFELLGKEKFDQYVKENAEIKNDFISNLLLWNKLSFLQKLKTIMKYKKIINLSKEFDDKFYKKYQKYKRLFNVFFAISLFLAVVLMVLLTKGV